MQSKERPLSNVHLMLTQIKSVSRSMALTAFEGSAHNNRPI